MGNDWAQLALQPQPSSLLPPDLFSYTHLLSALEKLGHDRLSLAALEEMKKRDIKVICAPRTGRVSQVVEGYLQIGELGQCVCRYCSVLTVEGEGFIRVPE